MTVSLLPALHGSRKDLSPLKIAPLDSEIPMIRKDPYALKLPEMSEPKSTSFITEHKLMGKYGSTKARRIPIPYQTSLNQNLRGLLQNIP